MRNKTTTMRYQVEAAGVVHESRCTSLREARKVAKKLKESGCWGVQIARYDTSECSDYYEVVEVL